MADRKVIAGHATPVSVSADDGGYLAQILALLVAWVAAIS